MHAMTRIIVGVDFTSGSRAALIEALRIAQWNQASVRAVHVIDSLVVQRLEEALEPFQQRIREGLVLDARTAWWKTAAGVEGAEAVTIDIRVDNRVHGILAAAREAGADLPVLGAYGDRAPDIGLGSVATACVRHAPCPVLLVRDTKSGPFRRIVACIDFSHTSKIALEAAASVATRDGAELHVLHVFDAPWREFHYRAPTAEADPHFVQQFRQGLDGRLRTFAGELGHEISFLKPVFAVVDHGGHRSGITEYAHRIGADLIVLGTRGHASLRELLLGSTAERALRDSSCSVLAIRPPASS
jgi:nucleotide-binding universal stress UspA family protein